MNKCLFHCYESKTTLSIIFQKQLVTPTYLPMNSMYNNIKLVEGIYSPINSADVLLSLIADKIKFHNLQILSSKNEDDPNVIHAKKRIAELKESRKLITNLIIHARDQNFHMKIDGTVNIELFKPMKT